MTGRWGKLILFPQKILEEYSLIEPDPDAVTSTEEPELETEPTNEDDNNAANCLSAPCEEDNSSEMHLARRSSIVPEPIVDGAPSSDPTETVVEVLSSDNSLVEVSTAPAEDQAIGEDNLIENDCPLLHPESMKGTRPKLEMTTPRRSEQPPKNQILYTLYRQRLTNDASPKTHKRPLSERSDTSTAKRSKQHEPDIIVLD